MRSIKSGSWKTQEGGRLGLDLLLDFVPLLQEQGQVQDEIALLLAFAGGAHDHAHALGDVDFAQDLLQALAFLRVFDLARNAALIGIGQKDQVASGQDQVGGDARPLGADGAFGHLHDDFAAGRIKARDVLLRDARAVAPLAVIAAPRLPRRCQS